MYQCPSPSLLTQPKPSQVVDVQFGDGTAQRSHIDKLTVTFDGPVDIDLSAFSLIKRGSSGGTVTTAFTTQYDSNGNTVATLSFTGSFTRNGGALHDGYYQLTIDGSKVTRAGTSLALDGDGNGSAGGNFIRGATETDNFFAFFADTNGDGVVGIAEFGQFRSTFGRPPPMKAITICLITMVSVLESAISANLARFGKPKLPF